jgi:hypothetical protein
LQHVCGTRQETCHPCRERRCLLKGCERHFRPTHPQARYCSSGCRQAARRWRRRKASQRYRASAGGQERRREQQRRLRQRRREQAATTAEGAAERVGQRPAVSDEDFPQRLCDRPGCYVQFVVKHEWSCQRFCSVLCRLALRRVLDREARYRRRRRPGWRRTGWRSRARPRGP